MPVKELKRKILNQEKLNKKARETQFSPQSRVGRAMEMEMDTKSVVYSSPVLVNEEMVGQQTNK